MSPAVPPTAKARRCRDQIQQPVMQRIGIHSRRVTRQHAHVLTAAHHKHGHVRVSSIPSPRLFDLSLSPSLIQTPASSPHPPLAALPFLPRSLAPPTGTRRVKLIDLQQITRPDRPRHRRLHKPRAAFVAAFCTAAALRGHGRLRLRYPDPAPSIVFARNRCATPEGSPEVVGVGGFMRYRAAGTISIAITSRRRPPGSTHASTAKTHPTPAKDRRKT